MRNQGRVALFFLLPNLVGFLVFTLGPVLVAAGMSLYRYQLATGTPEFVGIANFSDLISLDSNILNRT